jgi:hypothetical protein
VRWSFRSTAAGLRLRKNCSGERGPGKLERGGHTEGCPEQLMVRRNSSRQRMGRGRDGGRITDDSQRWAVAELSGHARRARERARGFG